MHHNAMHHKSEHVGCIRNAMHRPQPRYTAHTCNAPYTSVFSSAYSSHSVDQQTNHKVARFQSISLQRDCYDLPSYGVLPLTCSGYS